jgi:hypothetical protein
VKHGDERNRKQVRISLGTMSVRVAGSENPIEMPRGSTSHTEVERYCGWCKQWVNTRNIIEWMLHTECGHDWHDAPEEEREGDR